MERRLDAQPSILHELVWGDAGAGHITEVFFAMCRTVSPPKGGEIKVAQQLHDRMMRETRWRNHLAHGDLQPASQMPGPVSHIVRIRAMEENPRKFISLTTPEIDERTDALIALGNLLAEFSALSFHTWPYHDEPNIRVGDIFVIREKQVARAGPRVTDYPNPPQRGYVVLQAFAASPRSK